MRVIDASLNTRTDIDERSGHYGFEACHVAGAPSFGYSRRVGDIDIDDVERTVWVRT